MIKDIFQKKVKQEQKSIDTDLDERIKAFEKEFIALLDKYKLNWQITTFFPQYNILPPEITLAMTILSKHDIQYKFAYSDKSKEKRKEK